MGHDAEFDRDFAATSGPDDDSVLRDELTPGEKIVWQGRPRPMRPILAALPLVFFGVAFVGFAFLWFRMTGQVGAMMDQMGAGALSYAGLLPLSVGGLMILSPAWVGWVASRTRYAVTDRRVLICTGRPMLGVQVQSYRPEALTKLVRNQRGDGTGDLIFEEVVTRDSDGDRHVTRRGFFGIDDVRAVEALIRSTFRGDRA